MKTVAKTTYKNQPVTIEYERFPEEDRPTEMIMAVGRLAILRAADRDGAIIGYVNNPNDPDSTVTTVAAIINKIFWFGVENSLSSNQIESTLEDAARKLTEALNSAPGAASQWLSTEHEADGETYPKVPLPTELIKVHLKTELVNKVRETQSNPDEFFQQLFSRTGALDAIANSL